MSKKVTLSCEQCKNKNYRIGKTLADRLLIKKCCRKCNMHQIHKEEK